MAEAPGLVVLFGSGETTPSGRKVFDWLLRRLPVPVRVGILETPAGFELNSPQVAGRIGDFLEHRLQNYRPEVTIVPARKRGTPFSTEAPEIAALLPGSDLIFLGPGSPTYAVRQLGGSLVWHTVQACQRLGAALVLASAATIAASAYALPVYEIYKAGEDLHWRAGLNLLAAYGLSVVFVPHWNNRDGGTELDTSRCYMGQARFEPLLEMLPPNVTVVGIDERTALALDLASENCRIVGRDGVTILRAGEVARFQQGHAFPIHELGAFRSPEPSACIPVEVWARVALARSQARVRGPAVPSPEVMALVQQRERLRASHDYDSADALRGRIADLGWQVLDTPDGPQLEPVGEGERDDPVTADGA